MTGSGSPYHCSGYCLECGRKLDWAGTHWGRHSPGRHVFWRQHLLAVIARQLRKLEEAKGETRDGS